jgi:hypothetical protein
MSLSALSFSKKAILLFVGLAFLTNLFLLAHALVYADPAGSYRKNGIVIGMVFILITRIFKYTYRAFLLKRPEQLTNAGV